jgi:hypothetical protein
VAQVRVKVDGGVFSSEACVVGKIYLDCNGNRIQDTEELGIPGVRFYFEDGTNLTSDSEGKYSICGLKPITHVMRADPSTLPIGSRLGTVDNRNVGDAQSRFVDLRNGELHRADFHERSCSPAVVEQVKARRTQGGVYVPEVERAKQPTLTLDPRTQTKPELPRYERDKIYQDSGGDWRPNRVFDSRKQSKGAQP